MTLDIPIHPEEPKPWTVHIWRYMNEEREPFVLRKDAIEHARMMSDSEYCWVEGIFGPDGFLDEEASRLAGMHDKWFNPWCKKDRR